MKYRRRIYYSAVQRAEIRDRWQRGVPDESLPEILCQEESFVLSAANSHFEPSLPIFRNAANVCFFLGFDWICSTTETCTENIPHGLTEVVPSEDQLDFVAAGDDQTQLFFRFNDCEKHDAHGYDQHSVCQRHSLCPEYGLCRRHVSCCELRCSDDNDADPNRPCAFERRPIDRRAEDISDVEQVKYFKDDQHIHRHGLR